MSHLKSFAALSLFLLLALSGCKNNDLVSPNDTLSEKQLAKIVQDANNFSTFLYEGNKLSKYESISDSKIFSSIQLDYNGNKRPQTEHYTSLNEEYLKKYFYDSNDKLEKTEYMFKDSLNTYSLKSYMKYLYDELNRLVTTEQYNVQNQIIFYTEYYYDNSDNVTEKRFNDTSGLVELTTMEYDNKINPWYNLREWLNYDVAISKNNLIKSTQTGQDSFETTIIYTYDSYGYPLTRTMETIMNNIKTIVESTYEYK